MPKDKKTVAKKAVAKLVPHEEETKEVAPEVLTAEAEVEEVESLTETKDEFADVPETEEHVPQGYYRNELIVRSDNRIMNGRIYKEVETVTATYLITEAEYETNVKFK